MNTSGQPEEIRALDTAFDLASRFTHAEAKDRLQQAFPAKSFDEVTELYLRATDLLGACYEVGDQCRDKKMTNAQAIASLRQRFPGFSAENYEQSLNWGYFLSR